MQQISSFEQVRFDGQVLKEGMTVRDLQNPTGKPIRIQTIRWLEGEDVHTYTGHFGILAQYTPSRQYIAVLEAPAESWYPSRLLILNANGTVSLEFPNQILVNDRMESCHVIAVYSSPCPGLNTIRVAVTRHSGYPFALDRAVDIDAENGKILDVVEIR